MKFRYTVYLSVHVVVKLEEFSFFASHCFFASLLFFAFMSEVTVELGLVPELSVVTQSQLYDFVHDIKLSAKQIINKPFIVLLLVLV